jgi:hypothetical protein
MTTEPPRCPRCNRGDNMMLKEFQNVYEKRTEIGNGEPEQLPREQILTWRCQNA